MAISRTLFMKVNTRCYDHYYNDTAQYNDTVLHTRKILLHILFGSKYVYVVCITTPKIMTV